MHFLIPNDRGSDSMPTCLLHPQLLTLFLEAA